MRTRRVYWILSIVMLWITCALLFNYFYKVERKTKIEEIIGLQKINARLAIKNFEQLFSKWNNVLYYLSKDSNVIKLNVAGKEDMLKLSEFLSGELKGITRTDSTGKIIFTFPENSKAIGRDISRQKHMIKILSDHQPVVSDVFKAVQGYQAIVIHYPIFVHEKYYGSIALLLDFEKISSNILSDIQIGKSGLALMLTSDGTEIYCNQSSHIGKSLDASHRNLSNIADSMQKGKEGISEYNLYSNTSRGNNFAYYLPVKINNTFWSLAITYSEDEITASLINFRNRLLIILAIVFIGGIILSYYTIKALIIIRESELRKIAEKKLKESEEKYRRVIETTDTGYVVTDNEGKILDANVKFAQMTGNKTTAKILGKTLNRCTIISEYNKFQEFIHNSFNNTVHNLELNFTHEDGMVVPVEINACKVNFKNKEHAIMLCRNISERVQAREDLIKERTLLRTLIDSLPSGVFIKDTEYRKIMANPLHIESVKGHLQQVGLDFSIDIIGKTDFEIFPEDEAQKFFEVDRRVLEDGISILNQVEPGWGPDKEKIWLLVSKVPIKTKEGKILGMVGVTTDITDQKKNEEQLIVAKEKAEQSDKLKTAFLNNISHEIRTPLNAIVGFSGLMNDPDLNEERRDYFFQIINQSSNQLLMIITDIINIATIEAGQLRINKGIVDLNPIFDILYEQYNGNASRKNIKLSHSKGLSNGEAIIETDETKFLEILSNLINNAIKFTESGFVNYGYSLQNENLLFFVKDSGIGIKTEYQTSIFDRFWQADSQNYGGAGLGLSIAKTYVELLGGSIWFESEPGTGTSFYFTLPYNK